MASYSLQNVLATISGPGGLVPIGSGAAISDEGLSIEMVDKKNTMIIGGDGSGVHSLHASKAASIKIRLMKTSPENAALTVMYNLQTLNSAIWGQNVLIVTDPIRGDDYSCTQVAFAKFPGITWSKDPNVNEWDFDAIEADPILGIGF